MFINSGGSAWIARNSLKELIIRLYLIHTSMASKIRKNEDSGVRVWSHLK
jgi:hypothetical protein